MRHVQRIRHEDCRTPYSPRDLEVPVILGLVSLASAALMVLALRALVIYGGPVVWIGTLVAALMLGGVWRYPSLRSFRPADRQPRP